MSSIDLKKEMIFLYTKFRRHYGENSSYAYKYDERTSTLLDNFIVLLQDKYELESLGGEFFVDYFWFAFSFWHNSDPRKSKIPYLNMIVGPKGFKRWVTRKNSWKYWANKNIGAIPEDLTFSIKTTGSSTKKVDKRAAGNRFYANFKEVHFTELSQFEEDDKKRFHNTENGFMNCLEFTTLYNKKSKLCIKCRFANKCKSQLREVYPEIAKVREI